MRRTPCTTSRSAPTCFRLVSVAAALCLVAATMATNSAATAAPRPGSSGSGENGPVGNGPGVTVTGSARSGREARPVAQRTTASQLTAVNAPCVDAVFIGARGSGQSIDDTDGFGPQVGGARDLYTGGVTDGHRIRYWPVIYPAYDTDLLFTGHVHQYFVGLDQGVDNVAALLKARAKTCPQEHYVLAGYSQGAMVIHRVLWEIASGRIPLPMERIDGVIEIADGDRQAGQGGHRLGTAPDGSGVSLLDTKLSGVRYEARRRAVPASLASRFYSICDFEDIVCDPLDAGVSIAGGVAYAAVHLRKGVRIHTHHYLPGNDGAAAVAAAASATAAMTSARAAVPALQINADLPPGLVDHPYVGQFTATGGAAPYTFWSNQLPSGFTLTADGQLTGSFATPPPVTFKVRVADANGQLLWQTVTIQNDDYVVGDCGIWAGVGQTLTITAGDSVSWGYNGSGPISAPGLSSYHGTIYYGDGTSEPIAAGEGPYTHTYNVPGTYPARVVADGVVASNGHQCHDDESYPIAVNPPPPPPSWAETTGGVTHTWTNYTNAGGTEGPTIAAYQTVQIACKVQGWVAPDGNNWWYRIASPPWNGTFYASADAFYNNGSTSGSLHGTPFVDNAVANC